MYTQLEEHLNNSSFDRSNQGNRNERRSGSASVGSTTNSVFKSLKRNSSSELRQNLMDDEDDFDDSVIDSISLGHSLKHGDHASVRSGANRNPIAVVDDPFHAFQQDLLLKFDLAEGCLEQLQHVVRTTDTAVNGHQVKETKKQLKRHVKNVELALGDLQTTVKLVEKKPDQFPNIDAVELTNRKDFIRLSTERISSIKSKMNSQDIKSKMFAHENSKRIRRSGGNLSTSSSVPISTRSGADIEEAEFLGAQGQYASAKLLMQQQEETLDDLDSAVVRVGQIASNIHDELGHQNKMLKDLEDDLQNAEEELGMVMGKLGKILKTKNKWQLGTIMMLSLIVVILFFLVLYT